MVSALGTLAAPQSASQHPDKELRKGPKSHSRDPRGGPGT